MELFQKSMPNSVGFHISTMNVLSSSFALDFVTFVHFSLVVTAIFIKYELFICD